jgi:hypothetical protein
LGGGFVRRYVGAESVLHVVEAHVAKSEPRLPQWLYIQPPPPPPTVPSTSTSPSHRPLYLYKPLPPSPLLSDFTSHSHYRPPHPLPRGAPRAGAELRKGDVGKDGADGAAGP